MFSHSRTKKETARRPVARSDGYDNHHHTRGDQHSYHATSPNSVWTNTVKSVSCAVRIVTPITRPSSSSVGNVEPLLPAPNAIILRLCFVKWLTPRPSQNNLIPKTSMMSSPRIRKPVLPSFAGSLDTLRARSVGRHWSTLVIQSPVMTLPGKRYVRGSRSSPPCQP